MQHQQMYHVIPITNHHHNNNPHSHDRASDDLSDRVDVITLSEEMSFALRRGNFTLVHKLEKSTGAVMTLDRRALRMKAADDSSLRRVRKYLKALTAFHMGFRFELPPLSDDDITVVWVPQKAQRAVTGERMTVIHELESSYETLMLFLDNYTFPKNRDDSEVPKPPADETVPLLILGGKRNRRQCELRVMSSVERVIPGFYSLCFNEGSFQNSRFWGTVVTRIPESLIQRVHANEVKISNASLAAFGLVGHYGVISGSPEQQRLCQKCLNLVLDPDTHVFNVSKDDKDFTVVNIEKEIFAFVTSVDGNQIRELEEQNGVLIAAGRGGDNYPEDRAVICGDRRGRRVCELRFWSRIEVKINGKITKSLTEAHDPCEGWGTTIMKLHTSETAMILGPKGSVKRKLAAATECVVEIISPYLILSGTLEQRQRTQRYIKFIVLRKREPFSKDNSNTPTVSPNVSPCLHPALNPSGFSFIEFKNDLVLLAVPRERMPAIPRDNIESECRVVMFQIPEDWNEQLLESHSIHVALAILGLTERRAAASQRITQSVEANRDSQLHNSSQVPDGIPKLPEKLEAQYTVVDITSQSISKQLFATVPSTVSLMAAEVDDTLPQHVRTFDAFLKQLLRTGQATSSEEDLLIHAREKFVQLGEEDQNATLQFITDPDRLGRVRNVSRYLLSYLSRKNRKEDEQKAEPNSSIGNTPTLSYQSSMGTGSVASVTSDVPFELDDGRVPLYARGRSQSLTPSTSPCPQIPQVMKRIESENFNVDNFFGEEMDFEGNQNGANAPQKKNGSVRFGPIGGGAVPLHQATLSSLLSSIAQKTNHTHL